MGPVPRNNNPRAERTRLALQGSLVDLARERGFNRLSVEEIARRAMVNRATFYRYFGDKYYLAREVFRSALRRMERNWSISRAGEDAGATSHRPVFSPWAGLFEHLASNAALYGDLLRGKGSPWFLDRMREDVAEVVRGGRAGGETPESEEMAQWLFSSAIVGIAYFWLRGGMKHRDTDFTDWFSRIASYIRLDGRGT